MFRVVVLDAERQPTLSRPLSATPLYVGRATTNDLVIADKSASSRHAAVWSSGGRVFVEDLGSRNGTFAGDRRIRKVGEVFAGDELRLGHSVLLRIEPDPEGQDEGPVLLVEDVANKVRVPLRGDRFRIGPGARADVHVEGGADEVVLLVDPDRRVWIGRADGSLEELDRGATFEVGERAFRVRGAPLGQSATWDTTAAGYPYALHAELDGPTGPRAELSDPESGSKVEFNAPNRAVLLYLLGRRVVEDLQKGVPTSDRGWCGDAEVASGLWGRDGEGRNLNVLVTRVRNDVRRAGLDPWFLEKKQGFVRVRLERIEVGG